MAHAFRPVVAPRASRAPLVPPAHSPPGLPSRALAPGMRPSARYLPELESLRGLAIVLVMAFHIDGFVRFPTAVIPASNPWKAFVFAGHAGVDLFFVLSAFLLSLPFFEAATRGATVDLRRFAARRALRILPLYWVVVLVAAAATARQLADLRHALPYLFFLQGFPDVVAPLFPWSSVWWSLATEIQFYCLLPLLGLALGAVGWQRRAVFALLASYLALYMAAVIQGGPGITTTVTGYLHLAKSVLGRGPLFLWGVAAAWFFHHHGSAVAAALREHPLARRGGADALLWFTLAMLGFLLDWVFRLGPIGQNAPAQQWWHVVEGGLWASLLLMILLFPLRTRWILHNSILVRLGILSYSLYLLHTPVIFPALRWLRPWVPGNSPGWTPTTSLIVVGLTFACVGLSALTYRFIEVPFLTRKARITA